VKLIEGAANVEAIEASKNTKMTIVMQDHLPATLPSFIIVPPSSFWPRLDAQSGYKRLTQLARP
jgi:hypothetical protein